MPVENSVFYPRKYKINSICIFNISLGFFPFFFLISVGGFFQVYSHWKSSWRNPRTVSVKTTSTKIQLTKSNTISGDFFFMEYRTVRIYRKGNKPKEKFEIFISRNLPPLICFPLCSFYRVRPFIFLSITGMSICQKHKEISLKILFV